MQPILVRDLLRSLRKVRAGSLDLEAVDPSVRPLFGENLAGACRALAQWVDSEVRDPRAADAFIRTYGLGRMPESREVIGRTLRSATGRVGISPGAVDDLVRGVEARLARQVVWPRLPNPWGAPTPSCWVDPFPRAATCRSERRQLEGVLYAAWADVPEAPVHECSAALLLYEQEHGLRPEPVLDRHREQRRRLRRLAWSMLTVARERHVGKEPDDVLVDLLLGPRRIAVVEHLPEEAAALLLGAGQDPDRIEEALGYVREAVRYGRPEAPELLGLLREAIARGAGPPVPAAVTAGAAALSTILAREQRLASGVLAAAEVVALAAEVADDWSLAGRDGGRRRWHTSILNDGLRAAQELAELHDILGNARSARRALGAMTRLRPALDPGDRAEVQAWRQQHLQTRSTLARHAAAGRHAEEWLRQADRASHLSLELAEAERLPAGYRLVPASQLVAIAIAGMRLQADAAARARPERRARAHLARAIALSQATVGTLDRPIHSARLAVARRWWELALLCGDPDEVVSARRAAHGLVRPCTLPHDLEKVARLEATSRAQGIAGADVPVPGTSATA